MYHVLVVSSTKIQSYLGAQDIDSDLARDSELKVLQDIMMARNFYRDSACHIDLM